jgi:hypothetical protein
MRISQKTEWILIAVLIAYIAFTPGLPAVRQLLSTDVGKALGLAAVVAVWKYVSPVVALLLTVSLVRCASMREYMENPSDSTKATSGSTAPPNTYCPENYNFDNGQCKNKNNDQTIPATVCLAGQTWDGTKCQGSSAASAPPPTATPPPSTSTTTMKQPFSNMTPSPVTGGVQPDIKEKMTIYAPANF